MSFEIAERDLAGRIGKLRTKSGEVETPALLPVINPLLQPISPKILKDRFAFKALITNAYIISKNLKEEAVSLGIHRILDFDRVIMTDSGAYQNLIYGKVDTTVEEITRFQEDIGTDIAVILDVPTGWKTTREKAAWSVEETLRRAQRTIKIRNDNGILWVGPIQGGRYLELVTYSAKRMGELPFDIYALGSPTKIMEQYFFDILVDMIFVTKTNLPLDRPLHLFGAGHPLVFAMAAALGCDLFDSAAYALYARNGRYMTEYGTSRFEQLEYLPCSCPICSKYSPSEIRDMFPKDREKALAEHNIYQCQAEIRRIKQSIVEGRLWELLESRARSHPALLQAFRKFDKYFTYLEKNTPTSKRRGLFYFDSSGISRPEIVRHRRQISEKYVTPEERKLLLLLPQTLNKPFHTTNEYGRVFKTLRSIGKQEYEKTEICAYAVPFGVVPLEIDEVYPLSQFEATSPFDEESVKYVCSQVKSYISSRNFTTVLLHYDRQWGANLLEACRKACKQTGKDLLISYRGKRPWSRKAFEKLEEALKKASNRTNLE